MRILLPAGPLLAAARELLARAGVAASFATLDPFAVPGEVARGGADAGLCGHDHLREADLAEVENLLDLGLDPADLVVAARRPGAAPATVATAYPRIAARWAEAHRVPDLRVVSAGQADADLLLARVEPGGAPAGWTVVERILRATTCLVVARPALRTEGDAGPLHALVDRLKRAGIRRDVLGAQTPAALEGYARDGWGGSPWGRVEEGW